MEIPKVTGTGILVNFLALTAIYGALHLAATSNPNNKWAKAWLGLGL